MQQAFSHVFDWVFDLDNTLYPSKARLFDQIEGLIKQFVIRELDVCRTKAHYLRELCWAQRVRSCKSGQISEHS